MRHQQHSRPFEAKQRQHYLPVDQWNTPFRLVRNEPRMESQSDLSSLLLRRNQCVGAQRPFRVKLDLIARKIAIRRWTGLGARTPSLQFLYRVRPRYFLLAVQRS